MLHPIISFRYKHNFVFLFSNTSVYAPYVSASACFVLLGSDLHAIQCGAGAAHTAGPKAALLRQRPVAEGQQLTAQPQVLPAQTGLKATFSILSEQLAASADVLSSKLWEGRCAVCIVPGKEKK